MPVEACTSDMERFGLTTCAHCSELLHQDEAKVYVYYDNGFQDTEHFCNEHCQLSWQLATMRAHGL